MGPKTEMSCVSKKFRIRVVSEGRGWVRPTKVSKESHTPHP